MTRVPRGLTKLLYIAIPMILSFLALEAGVRIFTRIRPYYDIEMWRYGTEIKEKADNPKMSHRHKPNTSAQLYGVNITINSKGLRDREFEYPKPAGSYRILFLGDSLTLGWGVALEDLFTKRLEPVLTVKMSRPVEVINTGVGNYNTEQEWTYLQTEGYKYDPDHVMLLYFINDAEPTPQYKKVTFKEHSMLVIFLWSRITKLGALVGAKQDFYEFYRELYADSAPGWVNSKSSLIAIRDLVKRAGKRFTVFVCPELRKYREGYPFEDVHTKTLSFLRAEGIDYYDLLPDFRTKAPDEKSTWVSIEDSHPNALGHEIIAEGVVRHWEAMTSTLK